MHKTQLPNDTKQIQLSPICNIGEGGWISAFPTQNDGFLIVKDGVVFDENLNPITFANFKTAHRIQPTYVQRFSNGDYLLVEARQTTKHPNAFVCDKNGKYLNSFKLGDAINKIIIDKLDRIWVGYFDEGVFGGSEISKHGLNRFDKNGRLEYSFMCDGLVIDDCYNLNINAHNEAIIAPYSKPKVAIIEGQNARIICENTIGDVPFGLFANDDFIAKIGTGFDKNDPMGEWEDLAYSKHDLMTGVTTYGPMYDKLDENRFDIYESSITIINRHTNEAKLIQVFDENGNILSLRNCNNYQNRALISSNGKIYSIEFDETFMI